MSLPEPLTPPDLDLRDFDWMPLDVKRLRDSDLSVLAPGDAFRAAVLLWCASWHQMPAASLPKEDRLLANLAGYGRDLKGWGAVRSDALRGFVECSDGRLYHPVVAQKAIEANEQRNKQRNRTAAATSARRGGKRNDQRDDERNEVQPTLPNRTLPNQDQEKGEGVGLARPDLKLVGEDKPIPIDAGYEPSDAAIEYAFSLGMKKVDLTSELSKFIALSMASRASSYNPDMSFKAWCDRWLDFKRAKNPDWKPEPVAAPAAPPEPFVLVIQGTQEAAAWAIVLREQGRRPLFFCKQLLDNGVEVIAARCKQLWPDGFDEATGERIAPSNAEENAA